MTLGFSLPVAGAQRKRHLLSKQSPEKSQGPWTQMHRDPPWKIVMLSLQNATSLTIFSASLEFQIRSISERGAEGCKEGDDCDHRWRVSRQPRSWEGHWRQREGQRHQIRRCSKSFMGAAHFLPGIFRRDSNGWEFRVHMLGKDWSPPF